MLQNSWIIGIMILAFFLLPIWVYVIARMIAKGTFRSLLEEISRIFEKEDKNE